MAPNWHVSFILTPSDPAMLCGLGEEKKYLNIDRTFPGSLDR